MLIAVVNNNKVQAVCDIQPQDYGLYTNCQAAIDVTDIVPRPQVGWLFNGSTLYPDISSIPNTRITKLAFRQRFTVTEMTGLIAASFAQTPQGYFLQYLMGNLQVATYIDLARSDTQAAIQALVGMGLLTQNRAIQILTATPTSTELYTG